MPSLPRPKLFRRKRDKTTPSVVSKFCANFLNVFSVLFATKQTNSDAKKTKSREGIVKKIRRFRNRNKVGDSPFAEEVGSPVNHPKPPHLNCKFSHLFIFVFFHLYFL